MGYGMQDAVQDGMRGAGRGMQDLQYGMQDGCTARDMGCEPQDAGCATCDTGCRMSAKIPTSTRMPELSWRHCLCSPVGFLSMIIQSPA